MLHFYRLLLCSLLFSSLYCFPIQASNKLKPIEVEDIMSFRQIENQQISKNGQWLVLTAEPDRGNSEGLVYALNNPTSISVERGIKPQISKSGSFVLFEQAITLLNKETMKKDKLKKLIPDWVLVDTKKQTKTTYKHYKKARLSQNAKWIALLGKYKTPKEDKKKTEDSKSKDSKSKDDKKQDDKKQDDKNKPFKLKDENKGALLKVVNLKNNNSQEFNHVVDFELSPTGDYLVIVEGHLDGNANKVRLVDLSSEESTTLVANGFGVNSKLVWHESKDNLAFNWGNVKQDKKGRQYDLYTWKANKAKVKKAKVKKVNWKQSEWSMKAHNAMQWNKKSNILYFGLFPEKQKQLWAKQDSKTKSTKELEKKESKTKPEELFETSKIIKKRGLTIWHGDDPYIKPHEKKRWGEHEKRNYWFAVDSKNSRVTQLADQKIYQTKLNLHSNIQLFEDNLPYAKEQTYIGYIADVYAVNVKTGDKQLVVKKIRDRSEYSISPNGKTVIYFKNNHFHLKTVGEKSSKNLTENLKVSFGSELNDYPSAPYAYGIDGWSKDNRYAYLYDRYDIWQVKLSNGKMTNLTKGLGREQKLILRRVHTDSEQPYIIDQKKWLLRGYFDEMKTSGFFQLDLINKKVSTLLQDDKTYRFSMRATDSEQLLFTEEDFQQFPDIWVSNLDFSEKHQVTDINPQKKELAWGQKPELIKWTSTKGKALQGILIKPYGYKDGDTVPVLVYYYRYFTQRMYQFNRMEVNHRPNFPYYSSNGYAVFLPDIIFEIGSPGPSATQALVPGIQKLIDMGVADPDAIGLHGHSWSGYQTAFVITETDVFKAAVAGAPVSNMTSAYSGIRLKSGLARQFQYEMSQSRIGGSLNKMREKYIANSPVFFADRINTPLMIMFGDVDGAVPWEQGIELYLAMRREEKEVVFLQYHDEPHHLKKYPNKVDYTLRMKAYFDYHLKGDKPEPWIISGESYKGEKDKKAKGKKD